MIVKHTTDRPFFIKWWMDFFGYDGLTTYWNTIYYRDEECMNNDRLKRHELQHIVQMERDGKFVHFIKYCYYWIVYGYEKNPYEIEAVEAERKKDEENNDGITITYNSTTC